MPNTIGPDLVGRQSIARTYQIDRDQIRAFARAINSTLPWYHDLDAAERAGYPDLVAPPTFPITLHPDPIVGLTLPESGMIHGEQQFRYGSPIFGGDSITVVNTVESVKSRANTIFLTLRCEGRNQRQEMAFVATTLVLIREEVLPIGD